jgi:HAD superfamily hydrolase (TIGR01484 family)
MEGIRTCKINRKNQSMYILALATDYDETLAEHGLISDETYAALERLAKTGRKLIMVTGRELDSLEEVFPRLDIFDKIVAENGALLYTPASKTERVLTLAPPARFVERLQALGVTPLSVGRSIVATWEPHEIVALEVIKELGLELEIIFNKGAVMILPSGVNKATGLAAALKEMGLTPHNVMGVGDAQNDHAFLRMVGHGVAVANALPEVKATADYVLQGSRGAGVVELIDRLIQLDGRFVEASARHLVPVGADSSGEVLHLAPYDGGVLISGTSGIGKSTLAVALTERFVERDFQFCVFDPEGDYEELENVVTVGGAGDPPSEREILDLLAKSSNNVVVNMLGLKTEERPDYFAKLMPQLVSMRASTGRPHWLIIDEAHHLLPKARDGASLAMPKSLTGTILITVHPDLVSPDLLGEIDTVISLGPEADKVIATFCAVTGISVPQGNEPPEKDKVLFWHRPAGDPIREVAVGQPRQVRKRHRRKYAEGDLADHSFYFRGPHGKLKLKAQNLMMFIQLAEGIDDDTWDHHLRARDYSAWFRDKVKDKELADEAEAVETDASLDSAQSRDAIMEAVRRRYTVPAD